MAQALPRFCPRCGTPTRANMQHCATCGLTVEAMPSRSDDRQSRPGEEQEDATLDTISAEPAIAPTPGYVQQGDQPYLTPGSSRPQDFMPTWKAPAEEPRAPHPSPAPPGAPGPEGWNAPGNPLNNPGKQPWSGQAEGRFSPTPQSAPEAWNAFNNPPSNPGSQTPWAPPIQPSQQPWPTSAPQPKRRKRTGLLLVLLAILLVLGVGGYLAVAVLGVSVPGLSPTQSTIKTTSMNNLAINYAGIDITLLNAQQAQNFTDDPQTASNGMLRLNLREQNKTTIPIGWDYNESARLIVQGKPAIAPLYVKSSSSISPGTTETSVIDFAVANGGNLSNMIFQLGTTNEAQIQIPLTGQANLSQYQPKTTAQNGTMVYFGLNWTLTGATTSLDTPGQQAAKGMEYLTLNFSIDNTLSQKAISGSPFDYLRVQAGGKTVAPVSTTLPVSFATGETGKTGSATFLIPQNSAACTLILLSQDPGGSGQASTNFQIG